MFNQYSYRSHVLTLKSITTKTRNVVIVLQYLKNRRQNDPEGGLTSWVSSSVALRQKKQEREEE